MKSWKLIHSYKQNIVRSIFSHPSNIQYKPKPPKPSNAKLRRRQEYKERNFNKADPLITGEEPILSWDEKKGKALYKFLNEYVNLNRFTRNIPAEAKKEYIEKAKEMNLFYAHKYRVEETYNRNLKQMRKEIEDSALFLPRELKNEVIHNHVVYTLPNTLPDLQSKMQKEALRFKYTSEYLYQEQKMRLLPDETRLIERVMVNAMKDDNKDLGPTEEEKERHKTKVQLFTMQ